MPMQLTRCSEQSRQTLDSFYATEDDLGVGPTMTKIIERLRVVGPDLRVWGLTSLHHLYLLAEDSSRSPWYVSFIASDAEIRLNYLIPADEAPWPGARVVGITTDIDEAVEMITKAMSLSGGWPSLPRP